MSGRESETAMKELICIICPRGCHLTVDKTAADITVTGNACPRGAAYGKKEVTSPARVITSTVKVDGASHRRLPVKTNGEVPKGKMFEVVRTLDGLTVQAPVTVGQVIVKNVLGTGVDIVASRSMAKS